MNNTIVCPYCRMPFDEQGPQKIYCTGCGMPHHEDCYQENQGCTVFGCSRAPADDPKLQVSASDLNSATAYPGTLAPGYAASVPQSPSSHLPPHYGGPLGLSQPVPDAAAGAGVSIAPGGYPYAQAVLRQSKSRTAFIVLGIFLGAFGAHNFYAGYKGKAIGQLCLTLLTVFYLGIVSWIWAVIEICVVDKDSVGIPFN